MMVIMNNGYMNGRWNLYDVYNEHGHITDRMKIGYVYMFELTAIIMFHDNYNFLG